MTNQDAGPFFQRLAALSELFNGAGAVFSETKAELYFEALRDLPLELVVKGLNEAVKACTFMPKPAELRKLAIGDDEDQAERAWLALKTAMRAAGGYASLITADPALGEAILGVFGSWPAACALDLSPEMWASKRKEFGRVYRVVSDRALVGARYLPGICEQQNHGVGQSLKFTPVRRLEGETVHALSLEEAEQARTQIAAVSHGFSALSGATIPQLQAAPRGDTA